MSKREATFWDCDGSKERLQYDDIDDAVEGYLDDLWVRGMSPLEFADILPTSLTVYGYAKMEVSIGLLDPLESLLEHLDEEYGDPEGDATIPTGAMLRAQDVFLRAILAEYEPWACEKVCEEEVDALEWVKKNRPEWLKDEEKE